MCKFNLKNRLKEIYSKFPEAEKAPVIGITTNHEGMDATLREKYYEQVVKAGGVPMLIPPVNDVNVIINTLNAIDGLILSGGADINPLWQNEQPSPQLHNINSYRDEAELLITRLAYNRCVPIFGICRGMQTLVTALGGHVCQDINSLEGVLKHSQDADLSEPTHKVELEMGSMIETYMEDCSLYVNSFHHQAIDNPGPHLQVSAVAPDGIIEAVESMKEQKPVFAVQWHPEWMGDDGLPLFRWLVAEAQLHAKAKEMHRDIITLDSHCDTPMFFPQGVDFGTRDERILVDLHKMHEGRQTAVTMVSYLEQPKDGKTFKEIAPFPVEGPKEYADLIFDKIQDIVDAHSANLALARTPDDLLANKKAGKHTIMLGIENGQAFDHSLDNIDHFAKRGIVYTTLCHNGDNDICDSAKGCNTHNGVSRFGEKVIAEMNRLGIMVDLSHAGEKSFYDALEISRTPIVCSHSSARALCDHPRNLTDEQMRQLAKRGGVAQITLYPGFLRKEGEASIIDAMNHLEHAIRIMGIEHVGLGTDFDGDGGVTGIADASEIINFTRMLLARRYNTTDIQRIMGGNFMRVMAEVQAGRR